MQGHLLYEIGAQKVRPVFVHWDGENAVIVLAAMINQTSMPSVKCTMNGLHDLSDSENSPECTERTYECHVTNCRMCCIYVSWAYLRSGAGGMFLLPWRPPRDYWPCFGKPSIIIRSDSFGRCFSLVKSRWMKACMAVIRSVSEAGELLEIISCSASIGETHRWWHFRYLIEKPIRWFP